MKKLMGCAIVAATLAGSAFADGHGGWTSVDDASVIAFGSVKKDVIGEVHTFSNVNGTVTEDGTVAVVIDLTSLETFIDIRNERMAEHVFRGAATATLAGNVDMDDVSNLATGDVSVTDFEGTLTLGGLEADVEAEMLVARLSEDRVLVTTADFIMLSTADLGIDAGIDKLMQLAKLPGITRVTPITIRMVFEY